MRDSQRQDCSLRLMFLKDEGAGKSVSLWEWEVKGERNARVKIMFLPEKDRII